MLLLNLGGPDSIQAVRPFLYNLFSDRHIIKLGPSFLQKPVAYLISFLRARKAEGMYRLISGKSPILDITAAQAGELEKALNSELRTPNSEPSFKIYFGMRYWRPFIGNTVSQMYQDGIRHIIAMSLYPHYSVATSGSAILGFEKAVKGFPVEYAIISSWFDHPLYVDALVDVIKEGMESFKINSELPTPNSELNVPILFSAHSLPMSIVNSGDPYVEHIKATIREVEKRVDAKWYLSFQSRTGPVEWLGPSTDEMLRELAGKGVKKLLVVPISFVSDHVETLYEIDILYKNLAKRLDIELVRAEALNTHPLFIKALEAVVVKKVQEIGWTE